MYQMNAQGEIIPEQLPTYLRCIRAIARYLAIFIIMGLTGGMFGLTIGLFVPVLIPILASLFMLIFAGAGLLLAITQDLLNYFRSQENIRNPAHDAGEPRAQENMLNEALDDVEPPSYDVTMANHLISLPAPLPTYAEVAPNVLTALPSYSQAQLLLQHRSAINAVRSAEESGVILENQNSGRNNLPSFGAI